MASTLFLTASVFWFLLALRMIPTMRCPFNLHILAILFLLHLKYFRVFLKKLHIFGAPYCFGNINFIGVSEV